jgi:hypothetical protein
MPVELIPLDVDVNPLETKIVLVDTARYGIFDDRPILPEVSIIGPVTKSEEIWFADNGDNAILPEFNVSGDCNRSNDTALAERVFNLITFDDDILIYESPVVYTPPIFFQLFTSLPAFPDNAYNLLLSVTNPRSPSTASDLLVARVARVVS